MVQLTFVSASEGLSSVRKKELQLSAVRSHNAKLAHARKKSPVQHKRDTSTQKSWSTTSRWNSVEDWSDDDDISGNASSVDLYYQNFFVTPRSVKIFCDIAIPSASMIYEIFDVRPVYTKEWLPYLTSPIFYDAGSAAMQAIEDSTGTLKDSRKPSAAVLEHKVNALAIIRSELTAGNLDDVILMGILFLAVVEKRFGNAKAFSLHRQTLGKLVRARGGLDNVGEYIRCVLLQFEFFWAWSSGFSVLPLPGDVQAEYPESRETWNLLPDLPEGFRRLARQRKLPQKLLKTLHRIVLGRQGRLMPTESGRATNQNFWQAMSHRAIANGSEPYLEKLLCLTLTLYTTFARIGPVLNSQAMWGRNELTQRLPTCQKPREPDEENCVFWIWTAAVASWKTSDGTLSSSGRTLLDLQKQRFSRIFDSGTEISTLELFFCDDSLIDVMFLAT